MKLAALKEALDHLSEEDGGASFYEFSLSNGTVEVGSYQIMKYNLICITGDVRITYVEAEGIISVTHCE